MFDEPKSSTSEKLCVSGAPSLGVTFWSWKRKRCAMPSRGAFERLRTFSSSLSDSAQLLGRSAESLNTSHKDQTEALSIQAASLQETQVTVQEINQTSLLAGK